MWTALVLALSVAQIVLHVAGFPREDPSDVTLARDIPVATFSTKSGKVRAIVDTGGVTISRRNDPRTFATYYRGLGIDAAVGADYLRTHVVRIGDTRGSPRRRIPLDVRTKRGLTAAFVSCMLGKHSYRLLLDTAALAWIKGQMEPRGVVLLAPSAFLRLMREENARPTTSYEIATESGSFTTARSFVSERIDCGAARTRSVVVVERTDPRTFAFMKKIFNLRVDGDAGLAAFSGTGVAFDFPGSTLAIWG